MSSDLIECASCGSTAPARSLTWTEEGQVCEECRLWHVNDKLAGSQGDIDWKATGRSTRP